MSLHLLIVLTGEGHISEVFLLPELAEGGRNIIFEIIPLEMKLF